MGAFWMPNRNKNPRSDGLSLDAFWMPNRTRICDLAASLWACLASPVWPVGRFLEKWTLSALCVFKNKSEENLAVFLSGADPATPRPDFAGRRRRPVGLSADPRSNRVPARPADRPTDRPADRSTDRPADRPDRPTTVGRNFELRSGRPGPRQKRKWQSLGLIRMQKN